MITVTEIFPNGTVLSTQYNNTFEDRCIKIPAYIKERSTLHPKITILIEGIVVHKGDTNMNFVIKSVRPFYENHKETPE